MKDTAKELHEKCKKLNSDQLIEVLYLMNKNEKIDPFLLIGFVVLFRAKQPIYLRIQIHSKHQSKRYH